MLLWSIIPGARCAKTLYDVVDQEDWEVMLQHLVGSGEGRGHQENCEARESAPEVE